MRKRSVWNAKPEKWENILRDYLERTGVKLISRPQSLNNKSKIVTECKHGQITRDCGSLETANSCCKRGSKECPSWNSNPQKWEEVLNNFLHLTGSSLISKPNRLTAKSRVKIQCKHGTTYKFCETLQYSTSCCRYANNFKKPLIKDSGTRGLIYLVEYYENNILHYKLGITKHSVKRRLGKKVKPIKTWHAPIWKCFEVEQKALKYAEEMGWRYRCSSTTELIYIEGIEPTIRLIDSLCLV